MARENQKGCEGMPCTVSCLRAYFLNYLRTEERSLKEEELTSIIRILGKINNEGKCKKPQTLTEAICLFKIAFKLKD